MRRGGKDIFSKLEATIIEEGYNSKRLPAK